MKLASCDSPILLDTLAARVRASSNFRFNWQSFRCDGVDLRSAADVREALDVIVASERLHRFLCESHVPLYDEKFEIEPIHEHCRLAPADGEFEAVLASAAGDHLGAYSRELRDATAAEKDEVRRLFRAGAGEYVSYQLLPGEVAGCPACAGYNSHLFTTWFYGVAWDWCLLAAWPDAKLLWLGCLTDTD